MKQTVWVPRTPFRLARGSIPALLGYPVHVGAENWVSPANEPIQAKVRSWHPHPVSFALSPSVAARAANCRAALIVHCSRQWRAGGEAPRTNPLRSLHARVCRRRGLNRRKTANRRPAANDGTSFRTQLQAEARPHAWVHKLSRVQNPFDLQEDRISATHAVLCRLIPSATTIR